MSTQASPQVVFGRPGPHLILKASAGTGKTHRLSARYLRLITHGADPAAILASTFTRAAAGEIRERVVLRLARAACADAGSLDALRDAGGGLGIADYDRDHAARDLDRLLNALPRLTGGITTLDGFLASCVGMLAAELGIDAIAGLTSEDDPAHQRLQRQALINALAEFDRRDSAEALDALLVTLAGQRGVGRSSISQLERQLGRWRELLAEQPDPAAWGPGPAPSDCQASEQPQDLIAALVDAETLLPLTAKGTPNANFRKAWNKSIDQANAADWLGFLGGGLPGAVNVAGHAATYYKKELDAALVDSYLPLIAHAKAYIWQDLADRARSARSLIGSVLDMLVNEQRAAGRLTFSDLPRLLTQAVDAGGQALLDTLALRLDGRVRHLLLDEFQDTSRSQWSALLPLAGDLLAQADGSEPSTLIVGDTKQAIYAWRGGCSAIMRDLPQRHHLPEDAVEDMNRSYRSSQVVLDTVDRVFNSLETSCEIINKADLTQAATRVLADYRPHQAARDLPGRTRLLRTAAPPDDADKHETLYHYSEAVAEHIAELYSECPGLRIAVLLRGRTHLYRPLLDALAEREVPAIGEGGVTIDGHPAVGLILTALRLASLPDDRAAWTSIRLSPLADCLGEAMRSASSASAWVQHHSLSIGLPALVAQLVTHLRPHVDAVGATRLDQLLEVTTTAAAADTSLHAQPERLADVVAANPVQAEDAAANPVRLLTIHASKGLEYDLVVLPELHQAYGQQDHAGGILAVREHPAEAPTRILPWPGKPACEAIPRLQEWVTDAKADQREEDLCLLYVAMTRAVHGLDLIVPNPSPVLNKQGEATASAASLVCLSLGGVDDTPESTGVVWEHTEGAWPPVAERITSEPPPSAPLSLTIDTTAPARRHRRVRTPSGSAQGDRALLPTSELDLSAAIGLGFGSLAHHLLEGIGFIDQDGVPSADECHRRAAAIAGSVGLEPGIAAQVATRVHAFLSGPGATVLASNGATSCWRERPFTVITADGSILNGAFDRVHIWRDGNGTPTKALILDYKTDRISSEADLAAVRTHYAPQLTAYREALHRLLDLNKDAIDAELVLLHAG